MIKCDINRIEDKIKTFSTFGDDKNGGITRYALSKEDELARTYFKTRMESIGAEVVFDDYANMYAILKGSDSLHKKIVMASHCDSVLNGGNYDGILGVICAMEVLETIKKEFSELKTAESSGFSGPSEFSYLAKIFVKGK